MQPIRIAEISIHACPLAAEEGKETGGLNVYVLELSKALAKRGFTLDLYTRSQNPRESMIKPVTEQTRVIHLPAGPEKPYPKQYVRRFIPDFVTHMMKFMNHESLDYDIIHAHYYLSGIASIALRKQLKINAPLLVTFHTLGLMKNLIARTVHERETAARIGDEQRLVRDADHIIATSHADRKYLQYLYGCPLDRISIITPGVDTSVFRPIPKRVAKRAIGANLRHAVILAVGRIEALKGFDVLLYALKIFIERNRSRMGNVCVWIVGGDTSQDRSLWSRELKTLEALRLRLDLTTSVKFVGQQPQHALPMYYAAADVVVMPSHYESFGMVALEAMACGTPTIATDVSGVSTIIGEQFSQLVISANNPLRLATQLERLLIQPGVHAHLHQKLQQRALAFDWTKIARLTEGVYQKFFKR